MTCDVIQKTLWRATVSVSWVTRILGVFWRGMVKEVSAGPNTLLTIWIFGCKFVPKFAAVTVCSRLVARFTSEAQVRSQTCPYEVCGGRSGTGTGVPLEYLLCPPSSRWRQCSMLIHSCIPSTWQCRKTWLSFLKSEVEFTVRRCVPVCWQNCVLSEQKAVNFVAVSLCYC
jgi:hypothetical protein